MKSRSEASTRVHWPSAVRLGAADLEPTADEREAWQDVHEGERGRRCVGRGTDPLLDDRERAAALERDVAVLERLWSDQEHVHVAAHDVIAALSRRRKARYVLASAPLQ